ncbi:hypothetical protein IAR55_002754 [Kwoniella newhampshirensis]|uniref:Uncharacterized protein n=1 Tax=Kwoniella newhampshirensis TaxID=1651941 RepID=A0AAW0YZZ9_9TREE
MSLVTSAQSTTEEDSRAQRLASARKKLQTFRASRSSDHSATTSASNSISFPSSSVPSSSSPAPVMPLTTEASVNQFVFPPRTQHKGNEKQLEAESSNHTTAPPIAHRHRRSESQAHRRQRSSVAISSGTSLAQGLSRPSVMGAFELEMPKDIITTPATPLMDSPHIPAAAEEQEHIQVAARLSAFSFGAKTSASTFPQKRQQQQTLPASHTLFSHDQGPHPAISPLGSPTSPTSVPKLNRLSTPSSRPPSLLLTQPTPLPFGTPAGPPSRNSLSSSPSSPSTSARRRHSHTRSNSISLPNLKLGPARPTSLGVPSSPSYPSSPGSPNSPRDGAGKARFSGPMNGQRLKFEPSGRGAEAEKQRQESRRRALEKLTGGPPRSVVQEAEVNEISLPDLDDEDSSSVASSNRPLSGTFGSGSGSNFFYSRPSSLTLPPLSASLSSPPSTLSASPFSWSSPAEDNSLEERWSGPGFNQQREIGKVDGSGFGMELPKAMAKRPSLNRQLSALAEVDESEEDEIDLEDLPEDVAEDVPNEEPPPVPATEPHPSRLRELRLNSSASSSTPRKADNSSDSIHSFSFPRAITTTPSSSASPTKNYGTIGRGRPQPLASLSQSSDSSSPVGSMSTPKSAGTRGRRRFAPGSGSKGSSISYKKDDSISSSHDLSAGSRSIASPTVMSPAALGSPGFTGWGNPRNSQRPCPRPRALVGLGINNTGSGRVLNEVEEAEEDKASSSPQSANNDTGHADQPLSTAPLGSQDARQPRDEMSRFSFDDGMQWRDAHMELEMEREALKEDVEVWRSRCQDLEQMLAAERRESAILRDRVRKLGNRLSSVSSVPTGLSDTRAAESQLITEMREQLFTLTSSLEQERRAKEAVLAQVTELQQLRNAQSHSSDDSGDDEILLTARPEAIGLFPSGVPSPMITPPSPKPGNEISLQGANLDPNFARMKGWGFPRDVSLKTTEPDVTASKNKRDSFFGLSKALRRFSATEVEGADEVSQDGVDLPAFVITSDLETVVRPRPVPAAEAYFSPTQRAVSEPIQSVPKSSTPLRSTSASNPPIRSVSPTSTMPLLTGFLPMNKSSEQDHSGAAFGHYELSVSPSKVFSGTKAKDIQGVVATRGKLDFRNGCKCCVGQVIEF